MAKYGLNIVSTTKNLKGILTVTYYSCFCVFYPVSIFHFTCESFFSNGGSEVITVRDVWIEVEAQ